MADTKTLLKASELAGMFEVDLKTIHNWVDLRAFPSTRTPGGHLRFEASPVIQYCEAKGVWVPPALRAHAASVAGASV